MKKKQLLGILLAGTMMVGAAVPVFAADGDRVKITYAHYSTLTKLTRMVSRQLKISTLKSKTKSSSSSLDHLDVENLQHFV